MGLFSSKKKVYVSSSTYNLAGEEDARHQYLRMIVTNHSFTEVSHSLAESLNNAYLKGPGIRFRNFLRWSESSGYNDELGTVTGSISTGNSIDVASLGPFLPHGSDETVVVQIAEIGSADDSYWVDQYMLENHPDLIDTEYTYDFDEDANEIVINFEGGGYETFTPVGWDVSKRYMYVNYLLVGDSVTEPVEPGTTIVLDPLDPFPDVSAWTELSLVETEEEMELDTTVLVEITYSDSTPPETNTTTTTSTEAYDEIHGSWTRTTYQGSDGDGEYVWSLKENQYHDQVGTKDTVVTVDTVDEDIGGGVIKTTKTTTTTESLVLDRTYRIDEQKIVHKTWGLNKVFIYQYGSGNADLDAMFAPKVGDDLFYPFVPLRLKNQFISETYLPDVYAKSKRAIRKSIDASYDELIEKLADNDSIGDIDYAYVVFGVPLDVLDNACRKYVFNFFRYIYDSMTTDPDGDYSQWEIDKAAAEASYQAWQTWKAAQEDPLDPLYGTPEPAIIPQPQLPNNSVRIVTSDNTVMNYDMEITWSNIRQTSGTGLLKPDAKPGEVWFTLGTESTTDYNIILYGENHTFVATKDLIYLNFQETANSWRVISLWDLVHTNRIYRGKAVKLTARQVLTDEDESGFIIPLHAGVFRSMSLVDSTQMSTACTQMVLNSYQVVKQKWYTRGWFKVVMIVVVIVITIVTVGMGTLEAIGAYVGLTGTAAIVAGAAITVGAGYILSSIITRVTIALFGEKVGAIVGAIVSAMAGNVAMGLMNGANMSLSAITHSLAKADNIIRMTLAVGNGYADYLKVSAEEVAKETQAVLDNYEDAMKRVNDALEEMFPQQAMYIDPMQLMDATQTFIESSDSFLQRTLMAGSDVADLSHSLITNYADITLSTKLT